MASGEGVGNSSVYYNSESLFVILGSELDKSISDAMKNAAKSGSWNNLFVDVDGQKVIFVRTGPGSVRVQNGTIEHLGVITVSQNLD